MSDSEKVSLILAGVSAFVGSLAGIATLAWWLASKFNNVYRRMDEHELKDVERFNTLNLKIIENRIQAQTIEAVKTAAR